jgi:hypothetical protein
MIRLALALCVVLVASGIEPEDLMPPGPEDVLLLQSAAVELHFLREISRVAGRKRVRPLARAVATDAIARVDSLLPPVVDLAAKKGQRLPDFVVEDDRTIIRLAKAVPSRSFEREYGRLISEAARRLADRCVSRSRRSDDADIRAWASRAVPALRELEQVARELDVLEREWPR